MIVAACEQAWLVYIIEIRKLKSEPGSNVGLYAKQGRHHQVPREDKEFDSRENEDVSIRISDEVIASIASVAAAQVEGVSDMSGNLVNDIGDVFLGKKSGRKGVKVSSGQEEVELDLYINVKYGARIPEVANKVQENVKKSVESMTDLRVSRVNIHIQGISQGSETDT